MRPLARLPLTLVLVLAPLVAGCGGASPDTIGPSGVDELTVPTPTPEPADFVRRVDSPWLAAEPGRVWTYAVTGDPARVALRVSVVAGERVLGVATTGLREESVAGDGTTLLVVERRLAQDRAGNVWLFAETTTEYDAGRPSTVAWRAGENGAQAGLWLPAEPRVGDGWRTAYLPGEEPEVRTVVEVDSDVVDLEERQPAGEVVELTLTRGSGLTGWEAGEVEASVESITD